MSVSRNTTYNLIGAAVPIALALVTVPLYLKLVGTERYGVLAIAWLFLGYFGLFDLGLGRSTSYRIASLRDAPRSARADTFCAALAVNAAMGLIGGLLLLAAGHFFFASIFKVSESLRAEVIACVPLLACAVPVSILMGVLTGAMQGREKFLETNVVSLVSTTLFQLLPLAIASSVGPNLTLLVAASIFARVLALIVLAVRCYLEFCKGCPVRLNFAEVPPLLKYGGWVNLTSLLGPLLVMVDRFAIGAVLGASAVTVYAVPLQLAQRIQILPGALTNALFPRLSAPDVTGKRELADNASRTLIALMSLPTLGAIFLMEPFLQIWVGTGLSAMSGHIGRIALIGFWINSFAFIPFVRLQASGRPQMVLLALLIEIPIYIPLLYVALKYFGFSGCAMLFAGRCLADYLLLTWMNDRAVSSWQMLSTALVLLSLGAWAADVWQMTQWQWWMSAIVLGLILAPLCWLTLPSDVKQRIFGYAGAATMRVRASLLKGPNP